MPEAATQTLKSPFQVRWPEEIRDQVAEYADRMGIPMNSAVLVFVNDGLQRAGFPGISGPVPSVSPKPSDPAPTSTSSRTSSR